MTYSVVVDRPSNGTLDPDVHLHCDHAHRTHEEALACRLNLVRTDRMWNMYQEHAKIEPTN
jgi:hypothetical protein